jgi:hypothetical protein
MKTVYVVVTRTRGTGGFDWYWRKENAEIELARQQRASAYFTTKGEFYKTGLVEHQTNFTIADADEITEEIDDCLCDYEDQLSLYPPDEEG